MDQKISWDIWSEFSGRGIGTDLNLDEWIPSWTGGSVRRLDQLRSDGPLIPEDLSSWID